MVRVVKAGLEFHPYFILDYTLKLERVDLTGQKHTIRNGGSYIIDAFTGKTIKNENMHHGGKVRGIIEGIFSGVHEIPILCMITTVMKVKY